MIRFNNCTFIYDNQPLIEHLYLEIPNGDKCVLFGPSGGGKSTLLHALMGFVVPEDGEVWVDNNCVNSQNIHAIRKQLAWLPQEFMLPYDTVREAIMTPFDFKENHSSSPTDERILSLFDQLFLEHELLGRKLTEISGGQRQRIMLAIAVLLNKSYILLDEPTSALDPESVVAVAQLLISLKDVTVIAVSHDERFISYFKHQVRIEKVSNS